MEAFSKSQKTQQQQMYIIIQCKKVKKEACFVGAIWRKISKIPPPES